MIVKLFTKKNDTTKQAARMFLIIKLFWYEGKSEVGPRALGHRSLVSNPTLKIIGKELTKLRNVNGGDHLHHQY